MPKYIQGKFRPKNPTKYAGDPNNIVYRSSWELKAMMFFDAHPDILYWASEELAIPYISPVDNRTHRYFVDFIIKAKTVEGKIETTLIEVKPESQQKPPKKSEKLTKRFVNESLTYATNTAKWEAAQRFALEHGWLFKVVNERDLGIKK